ncbi:MULTISPECIES: phosphoribosylformylglycinamidine synthase subunit PurS [unclassified Pseudoclavibacter]|jgi:phosphoribosylformylglycinamidine synthase PurS subunit|uniref:phosphoribosylformylglycinamidine synthase subunit PurS n=1 Tax=unclassified Pseudoclavibacter TaxID=2615177 RepID=UPI000CE8623D|nr:MULTISPECIES: phosphoribosylformylglycinamidine synthase subunit PurS [unclassified Pseudoclavibacter]MBS3180491.1 phosphoribosylformylglycinamidine synthase subunit PurS [Pseudoclavibacter sp. Marseille-Q4354]NYF12522.1 phosphoribosylformylglycinamidine synthase [Pseudoclavibacter sp. JAI123]PPG33329.1 phosphoribosylformylglycinamidine synthase [Pseudoclavibacter sp. RFBB5]
MPKIVVIVMPKQELLDPQGKAVAGALSRLGKDHLHDVRVGKRFEITTDREVTAELMEEISQVADELLANGVIEDVISIDVLPDGAESADDDADDAVAADTEASLASVIAAEVQSKGSAS